MAARILTPAKTAAGPLRETKLSIDELTLFIIDRLRDIIIILRALEKKLSKDSELTYQYALFYHLSRLSVALREYVIENNTIFSRAEVSELRDNFIHSANLNITKEVLIQSAEFLVEQLPRHIKLSPYLLGDSIAPFKLASLKQGRPLKPADDLKNIPICAEAIKKPQVEDKEVSIDEILIALQQFQKKISSILKEYEKSREENYEGEDQNYKLECLNALKKVLEEAGELIHPSIIEKELKTIQHRKETKNCHSAIEEVKAQKEEFIYHFLFTIHTQIRNKTAHHLPVDCPQEKVLALANELKNKVLRDVRSAKPSRLPFSAISKCSLFTPPGRRIPTGASLPPSLCLPTGSSLAPTSSSSGSSADTKAGTGAASRWTSYTRT